MNFLFDLDGTLTDPKPGITACVRHAMSALGQPLDVDYNLDFCIGPPLQNTFTQLLGSAERVPQAIEHYRIRFKEKGMYENKVYFGIPECLAVLGRRGTLFVATSKPKVFASEIVRHFGLAPYFKAVYGSELDGVRSDKGELIEWILQREDLQLANTVMIGDREHDMIGARKNGIQAFGVAWGYGSREELLNSGAKLVLDQPSQLEAIIL